MSAQENGQPQQVTPGMNVQAGPVTSAVARTPGGAVILHLEHTTGATVLLLDSGYARTLGEQLMQAATGIEIAHA